MNYYVINNDFHVESMTNHINSTRVNEFSIIVIKHNFTLDLSQLTGNIFVFETPFRKSISFWNIFQVYDIKNKIKTINFSKSDKIYLLTEYEPLNQYIAYLASENGSDVFLLEEGISFYAIYLYNNKSTKNLKYILKLFYLRYLIGFRFFRYVDVGTKVFPQIKDKYIKKIFLIFDTPCYRDIETELIKDNTIKYSNLDKNSIVFLSQPLYDTFISMPKYVKSVIKQLQKLQTNYKNIYFKFHPRDSLFFKNQIMSQKSLNLIFIDNQTLDNFLSDYKPHKAYSFFSDSLFKLRRKGIEVRFLYNEISELKNEKYLLNLKSIVKELESNE